MNDEAIWLDVVVEAKENNIEGLPYDSDDYTI